jgi:Phosphate-selective porin O and P
MHTKIQQATATFALAALSGMAMGQSGLDLDRAYASEIRSDAQTRSSLLGSGNGANLSVEVMTQIRYSFNSRDEQTPGALGDSDTTVGFSTPRSQIRMSGGVEGTDISGLIIFDFGLAERGLVTGLSDGVANLLVAQAAWKLNDDWTLLFGQWHDPVMGSDNFAPEHTLAADKSFMNEFFEVGYTQGIAFAYGSDNFKFVGAFDDGAEYIGNFGTVANSPFNGAGEDDFGITGRVDWLIEGTWDQFGDATSFRGSNYGVKLGGGAHYQTQGNTNPADPTGTTPTFDERTVTFWTVDAQVEGDGWNFMAEYVGHKVKTSDTVAADVDFTNHGFLVQGGFFFSDQWEGFARYDIVLLDDILVAPGTDDNYQTITAGFNYYFVPESHAAKFTLDATFAIDDSTNMDALFGGAGANDPNATGILGMSDSEILLRAQMTLVF